MPSLLNASGPLRSGVAVAVLLSLLPVLGWADGAGGGYLADELGRMDTSTAQTLSTPTLLPTLLNVVFSLAFVIGLVLVAYWGLLKWRARQGMELGTRVGLIKVLERQYLDAKHAVAVVEVGDVILTVGVGDEVTLLDRTDDPDAVERLRRMAPLPATVMGFKEQLERVGMRLKREEWGKAKTALKDQADELRRKTERVRGPKGDA